MVADLKGEKRMETSVQTRRWAQKTAAREIGVAAHGDRDGGTAAAASSSGAARIGCVIGRRRLLAIQVSPDADVGLDDGLAA
jgi:hypothetical protein